MDDQATNPAFTLHKTIFNFGVEDWRPGHIRMFCDIEPRMLNPLGTLHGGILLALMDEAGGNCGRFHPDPARRPVAVTVSLNGQFAGRAATGRIYCTGTLMRSGRRMFFARTEVTNAEEEILAFGNCAFRYTTTQLPVVRPIA